MRRDFDVVVLGAGGAGLAAAVSAAERGARVMVIEAGKRPGGSTVLSTGVFYAAGTSVQRARGIEDTPDAMFHYCMTLNQYRADASLIRTLCDEGASGIDWLMNMGVGYRPEDLYMSGVDTVARGHRATEHGSSIIAALDQAASTRGVEMTVQTRVRQLRLDEHGRIDGILVEGETVTAGGVVVATGGFGRNREMLARYLPDAAVQGDLMYFIGGEHSRGDGIAIGLEAGASLAGHNTGLIEITAGFTRDSESYLPPWLLFVNRDGRRFVRESAAYAVMAGVVQRQLGGEAIAIFDEAARLSSKVITTYKPLFQNWVPDRLDEFTKQGKLEKADTIEQLADLVGVRLDTLQTTIDVYNRDCDAGRDSMFFKDSAHLKPVRTPPFYGTRVRPAIVMATGTGLRIDRHARVLNEADRPITGLYAAGEASGGVITERYIGGGASIANNIVYGRIAGRNAAEHALTVG